MSTGNHLDKIWHELTSAIFYLLCNITYFREHDKWTKAIFSDEARILRSYLSTWRGYTKLMKSKAELRDLERQKDKSSAKVGQFLLNLQTLKKQLSADGQVRFRRPLSNISSPKRTPTRKLAHIKLDLPTEPPSVNRLSPTSKLRGNLGQGDPGLVDEAGHPLVSIREAATIVADLRGTLSQTSATRHYLQEQAQRLRYQQKELEEMELMMDQLQTGRAITNLDLYRSLIFKHQPKSEAEKDPKKKARRSKSQADGKKSSDFSTDISNLRGQAPVATRQKMLRNIIVPQEEITKVNREFLRGPEDQNFERNYESDGSEPEISQLFIDDHDEESMVNRSAGSSGEVKTSASIVVPTPPFLVQMKKRQEERAQKWEEIRQIHEKKAEEKKRKAYEEEIQRHQAEAEEKTKRLKMKAKLRKQAILEQKIRTEELERFKFISRQAQTLNETRLMKRYGLDPWKEMVKDVKLNRFLADKHYEKFVLKKTFHDWLHMTKSNIIMRRVKAEEFERQKLLSNSFEQWIDVSFIFS